VLSPFLIKGCPCLKGRAARTETPLITICHSPCIIIRIASDDIVRLRLIAYPVTSRSTSEYKRIRCHNNMTGRRTSGFYPSQTNTSSPLEEIGSSFQHMFCIPIPFRRPRTRGQDTDTPIPARLLSRSETELEAKSSEESFGKHSAPLDVNIHASRYQRASANAAA
jgi:hypothetical protein